VDDVMDDISTRMDALAAAIGSDARHETVWTGCRRRTWAVRVGSDPSDSDCWRFWDNSREYDCG
jgi:hypothetical protein